MKDETEDVVIEAGRIGDPEPLPAWFLLVCLAAACVVAWMVYIGATYQGPPPN